MPGQPTAERSLALLPTDGLGAQARSGLLHLLGARLAGAGGGGFLILVTKQPDAREAVGAALADEQVVLHDVCIDQQGLTTRLTCASAAVKMCETGTGSSDSLKGGRRNLRWTAREFLPPVFER